MHTWLLVEAKSIKLKSNNHSPPPFFSNPFICTITLSGIERLASNPTCAFTVLELVSFTDHSTILDSAINF